MMQKRLKTLMDQIRGGSGKGKTPVSTRPILQETQKEMLDQNISILGEETGEVDEKLHREVDREVQSAAEVSLKKLHVIQRGRCPHCKEPLRQHLFASICDSCGWHTFDTPSSGPVRIHLVHGLEVVEGERCYVVTTGAVLVVKGEAVVARIPAEAVNWIEYVWHGDEIEERQKKLVDRMVILCGWCNGVADPDADGFHVAHVAFGATQERYVFCSDPCYEAFRKMYPARVHRDCYERNCNECDLCIKRYDDEVAGLRMLAKDYLQTKQRTR